MQERSTQLIQNPYVDNVYRIEMLKKAEADRIKEVTEYQVNIDNYQLAIEKVEGQADMVEFLKVLKGHLSSSLLEQKKSTVILEVIQAQLKQWSEECTQNSTNPTPSFSNTPTVTND